MADKGGSRRMTMLISTAYGICRSFNWLFGSRNPSFFSSDEAFSKAMSQETGGRSMTYRLNNRLFLENGPAVQAAEARARRVAISDFYLAERARLEAARIVTGADLR